MVIKSEVHQSFSVQQRPWTPTKRRGPIAAEYGTPGPAAFSLPTTIGVSSHDSVSKRCKSPAFSFGGRHLEKRDIFVPGPGAYNITGLCHTGKESVAAPTISGRTKDPVPFKTPAPGAYNPEKAGQMDSCHVHAPSYSFGLKGKDAKPDMTPAPNSYSIKTTVGHGRDSVHKHSPSYSMGSKNDSLFNGVGKNSPGPGRYDVATVDAYKSKSPSYTLSSRTTIPGDRTQKPGPGAHSPEKVWMITRVSAPRYSFGIRHSPYIASPIE